MPDPMPADLQKWQATRAKGKWSYVLVNGVLMWGLPMFVVMTFVLHGDKPRTPVMLLVSALLWTLGGLFFGVSTWFVNEKRYQKYLADHPKVEAPPTPSTLPPPPPGI